MILTECARTGLPGLAGVGGCGSPTPGRLLAI